MIYILLLILFLLIFLVWFYYVSFIKALFITKVPYVWSFNRQLEIIKQLNLTKWKKIIDLWCGDGKALRFFEKQFWLKWIWYDINTFAILYGKIINKIKKSNVILKKENFIDKDLQWYDYIYIYLFPEFMEKIEEWIFKAKWKDTIIISNSFIFKKNKPFKIIWKKIYLYR